MKTIQQGTRRDSMEESQQGTKHRLCKKRVSNKIVINYAKMYTRQQARNYAGKHAIEVAWKQTRKYQ